MAIAQTTEVASKDAAGELGPVRVVNRHVPAGLAERGTGEPVDGIRPRGVACDLLGCSVARDGGTLASDTDFAPDGVHAAEAISIFTNQITELCWWGSYDGNSVPANDRFRIVFYQDDTSVGGGLPGDLLTGGFVVASEGAAAGQFQKTATGELDVSGDDIYEFHLTLSTPIAVTPNSCVWVSIVNDNIGASSVWRWASDTGNALHDDGVCVLDFGSDTGFNPGSSLLFDFDLAVCVNDLAPTQGCGSLLPECGQDIDVGGLTCNPGAGTGFQSDTAVLTQADDFFVNVDGQITEICLAGFYTNAGVNDSFDRTSDDAFRITIYGSTPTGEPDTSNIVARFDSMDPIDYGISPTTGLIIHTLELPTPVPVTAGQCLWLEAANDTIGNEWIWSVTDSPRNGIAGYDGLFAGSFDGEYSPDEVLDLTTLVPGLPSSDLSYCLSIDIVNNDTVCRDTTPPPNDLCSQATPVTINGASVTGDIRNAEPEFGAPPCGFYGVGETGDVFHTVTTGAQAQLLTATTCNPGTTFDTHVSVYCYANGTDCFGGLFCVAGDDDDVDCLSNDLATTVSWNAAPNTTYVLMVSGRLGNAAGDYELSVTGQTTADDPAPCQACDVDTTGATINESAVEACGDDTNDIFNIPGFDCTMLTQVVSPGDTVVGESFADMGTRDLDFFRIASPTSDGGLLFTVEAEQAMIWLIYESSPGACPAAGSAIVAAVTQPCEEFTFASPVLTGLDYLIQVVPLNFFGAACFTGTTAYRFSVETAPEGACCLDDGTCQPAFGAEDCAQIFGGTYAGDGTTCGDVGVCDVGGCPCELDGVAGVDVFDLLAYLALWFALDPAADIDGVAGVDVFDLLAFLECWFPASAGAPCP